MCEVLQIPRSSYYYKHTNPVSEDALVKLIRELFIRNRSAYGTRKLKIELQKLGHQISRRRIGRIMKEQGLVSKYTVAKFKPQKMRPNEEPINNVLDRDFDNQAESAVVVSDLTYVRVHNRWHYVCFLVDLFNREIIGHSVGPHKDAALVYKAFAGVKINLQDIQLFHTDRGNEFKNELIEKTLETFNIKRSLSMKGNPYDNAVAEATFKLFKTELINGTYFGSIEELSLELADYVNWFNNIRIHSSLGYLSPIQYKLDTLKRTV